MLKNEEVITLVKKSLSYPPKSISYFKTFKDIQNEQLGEKHTIMSFQFF